MKGSKLYLGSIRQGGGLVLVLTVSRARPRLKSLIAIPTKKTGMEMRSPMRMVTSLSTSILRMYDCMQYVVCSLLLSVMYCNKAGDQDKRAHVHSLYTINSWSM